MLKTPPTTPFRKQLSAFSPIFVASLPKHSCLVASSIVILPHHPIYNNTYSKCFLIQELNFNLWMIRKWQLSSHYFCPCSWHFSWLSLLSPLAEMIFHITLLSELLLQLTRWVIYTYTSNFLVCVCIPACEWVVIYIYMVLFISLKELPMKEIKAKAYGIPSLGNQVGKK